MTTATELTAILPTQLILGGRRLDAASGGELGHINPATGKVQQLFPLAGAAEVEEAVAAANQALPAWRRWAPADRRRVLLRIADLFRQNLDELAMIASLETGVPITQTPFMVNYSIEWLEDMAGWPEKLYGSVVPSGAGQSLNYTALEPLGIVGVITTWNGSLGQFGMSVGPALAAGCCVINKPSELAPFGMMRVAELCEQAGLPPGVLTVLPGVAAAGEALVNHPSISKISFTGGGETARRIATACAQNLKPSLFELGGKSAAIVFDDASIDSAIASSMHITFNAGQTCTVGSRLIVQDSVYDQFVERFAAALGSITVGDPLAEGTHMGPVITKSACDRVLEMVSQASHSARLVTGGERLGGSLADGFFVAPTMVADVSNDSPLAQHEVFGPVVAAIRFGDEQEAVAIANDSEFGLAAYVHTNNLSRAHRVAAALDAENIGVNGGTAPGGPATPFGGRKQSGYGKQGGLPGVMEFLHTKNIQIAIGD